MDILNGDGFYGHFIFYRLLPIDLHEFSHYYHFKVLNALSTYTIFTMYRCMKCVVCFTTLFYVLHDDVIKWKHFPRYWPFVRGIHRSPVNSPHKGHWRGALMFSLICVWINGWVNNREAGHLRRYRTHCDVSVMEHYTCFVRNDEIKMSNQSIWDIRLTLILS